MRRIIISDFFDTKSETKILVYYFILKFKDLLSNSVDPDETFRYKPVIWRPLLDKKTYKVSNGRTYISKI